MHTHKDAHTEIQSVKIYLTPLTNKNLEKHIHVHIVFWAAQTVIGFLFLGNLVTATRLALLKVWSAPQQAVQQ